MRTFNKAPPTAVPQRLQSLYRRSWIGEKKHQKQLTKKKRRQLYHDVESRLDVKPRLQERKVALMSLGFQLSHKHQVVLRKRKAETGRKATTNNRKKKPSATDATTRRERG
jgi:hypothetical protein